MALIAIIWINHISMIVLHLWQESRWIIFTTSKNGLENCHLHAKCPLWCWKSFKELQYKGNKTYVHSVWKSQKKSHSTLRAKRATFTFWVDNSSSKMPKMVNFGDFLKTWNLRSNSVTRQVTFNRTKIVRKCQNWKAQMRHF